MTGAFAWWRRWTAVTTAGELAGFAVPATAGALATAGGWPGPAAFAAVLGAGFVEGCALGYAQARAWRGRLPTLPVGRYTVATGAAAVLAYALGLMPSTLGDVAGRLVMVPMAVVAGLALLASIGTAQWLVLRRSGLNRPVWIVTTGGAWLAGLAVFMMTAMPLWQPGQPWWLVAAIGVGCGVLMAFTVAALTGLAAVRLVRPDTTERGTKGVNRHAHRVSTHPAA
jgi:hypothetical protein